MQNGHGGTRDGDTGFDKSSALADLSIAKVVAIGDNLSQSDWPAEARNTISLNVDCTGVFSGGASDRETLTHDAIEPLHRMWRRDPTWGPTIWAMVRRREMPRGPVERRIQEAGLWNLDMLRTEKGLRANQHDGTAAIVALHRYSVYSAWETARGQSPRPFDTGWWEGWISYTQAHPGWEDDDWRATEAMLVSEWRDANGHVSETVDVASIDLADALARVRNMLATARDWRTRADHARTARVKEYHMREAAAIEEDILAMLPCMLDALTGETR